MLERSCLWTYAWSTLTLRRSVRDPQALTTSIQGSAPTVPGPNGAPRGGQVVDPGRGLRDDDPASDPAAAGHALVGPIFDEETFARLLMVELRRFYVPRDARAIGRAWRPTLEQLEAARAHVARHGGRLVITLYPSLLQVDAGFRSALLD